MTDANISAIRAKLRFDNIEDFIQGYSQYISTAGLYIPMAPEKFKPMDSVVRFQFLLADGTSTALLGEGTVVHHQLTDLATPETPPGILVKFNKLSPSSKQTVERIVRLQAAQQLPPFITLSEPDSPPPTRERAITPAAAPPYVAQPVAPSPPEPQHVEEPQLTQPSEPVIAPPALQSPFDSGVSMSAPRHAMFEDPLASLFGDDDEPADPRRATRPGDSNPFASQPGLIAASQPDLGAMPSQPGLDSPSEGTRQPKTLGQTERGLQIMAYDQATEQADVDLSAFVGGEDDDIDSMFDDIFGGPSQAKEVPATAAPAPRGAPSFLSGPVAAVSREQAPVPPNPPPGAAPSTELLGLLDSLEGSAPEDDAPPMSALDLHAGSAARIQSETPAEGSLESLLALARRDLETPQEKKSSRDILDDLLGDDLPPPPTTDEEFSLPPSPAEAHKDKKQGGFFSRLFGNSDK